MNTSKTLSALFFACFYLFTSLLNAQDINIDMKKPAKEYMADYSKPFKVTFSNPPGEKMNVSVKTGELAFPIGQPADLKTLSISFIPGDSKLIFKDKDNKKQSIPQKEFKLQIGDQVVAIKPSVEKKETVVMEDVVVDLAGTRGPVTSFEKSFTLSFKGTDAQPKDVIISDGDTKITLKKQDLTKLKIPFQSKDGQLSIGDGKGNILPGDDNKPFKVDDRDFDITVSNKRLTISDTTVAKLPESDKKDTKTTCQPAIIIDPSMFAAVSVGACQLCDIRSKKEKIESRKDRIYSTDYIITYDALLKKDAYSICKHVFEKNKEPNRKNEEKLIERYIKVSPNMFAPRVGSQIRFEVINLPLNSTMRLVVDEQDVFNDGAGQFSSIINSLVNANIINPIIGSPDTSGNTKNDSNRIHGADIKKCFMTYLDQTASDVLKYMTSFRISSCAIEKHLQNLPIIFSRISSLFQISAATSEQLYAQLTQKIGDEVDSDNQVNAMKKIQLIVNALKAMEDVKPLAYTTLRAKNRDYIEVRYAEGSAPLSKPENIRMSGGMKIDFSAGFILTGLRDYSYLLKNVTYKYTPPGLDARDTTGNVIVQEDNGSNQVGVGLLTHFYPRISSHYNFGGAVGLMTSTNLNLRLMLGGSVMISSLFGSNNRISFSGGIVWGKVKRLSEKDKDYFNHPREVNKIPEFYTGASAPEPIDRSERSWFFAITMNFGGK